MYAFRRVAGGSSWGLGCDRIGGELVLELKEFQIDSIRILFDSFVMYRWVELVFDCEWLEVWQRLRNLYRVGSFVLGYYD